MPGKTAVVTGAARGLGKAIAARFLRDGYNVLAFDLNNADLPENPAKGSLRTWTGDVRSRADIQRAVDEAVTTWGKIDVLANVAGIASESPFLSIDPDEWARIIDVNLTGIFNVAQLVARQMVKQSTGGVILNMASKNGITAEVSYAHYNASKAGIILLTKTMAVELAPYGIRVNAVAPGYTLTPLALDIDSPEFMDYYRQHLIPLGRLGDPEDVAGAFAFLASDDARFITGHTLVIDGGQLSHDGRLVSTYPSKP